MDKKLRLGIIGAGNMGPIFLPESARRSKSPPLPTVTPPSSIAFTRYSERHAKMAPQYPT